MIMATILTWPVFLLLLLLLFSFFLSLTSSLNSDGLALLALKSAIKFDPTRSLSDWSESDDNPCRWTGIACTSGQVVAINLPDRQLSGYIPSEIVGGAIPSLRRLYLPNNNFSGPIPPSISSSLFLQRIVLSSNSLSGNIPPAMGNLTALVQLDLSENFLSGFIPPGLGELASLTGTLNLSYNRLSGAVPASLGDLPIAVSLDVRHNNLTGPIPLRGSLVNQGPTAFAGNPLLCGFPLQNLCAASDSIPPQSASSNFPKKSNSPPADRSSETNRSWAATAYSGASAVLAAAAVAISVAFVWWWWRSKGDGSDQVWKKKNEQVEKGGGGGGKSEDRSDTEVDSRFCVLDSEDDKDGGGLGGVEMEDLLRASAYVVGKGSMGIVYKVVLARAAANGTQSVAVRRLAEGGWQKLKDFDAEVQAIGRIEHPNLVRLRAYYWAPDEKLLIYDYVANGTLSSALHGRSPTAPALTWETRLKIASGIARGLSFLHDCSTRKYVHGNLKTSNVLLDHQNNPKISDFGLRRLVNNIQDSSSSDPSPVVTLPPPVQSSSFTTNIDNLISDHCCYSAPEANSRGGTAGHVSSKPTQRWDVYSFGVVIMELLTGQSPASFRHNHKLQRKDKEDVEGKEVEEEEEVVVLEEWVRKMFDERRPMTEIVDPGLLQEVSARKEVVALFHLALACTTRDPDSRPRMKSVSEVLDRMGQPASLG